jgi:Kef-type K+ transport system membrane component KefB
MKHALLSIAVALLLLPPPALASGIAMHQDPTASVLFGLAMVLLAAKVGGDLAVRLRQPPVLGEILFGVLLGNLPLVGYEGLQELGSDPSLDLLARLGVILLMFEVGLESTVQQMMQVGLSAFLVGTLGVIMPLALGWAASAWLLPEGGMLAHAFLGATLSTTSVGITARVLQDLDRSQSDEGRIILGAAVVDDIEGLLVLALVSGAAVAAGQAAPSYGSLAWLFAKALLFLVGSIVLGLWLVPRLFHVARLLVVPSVLLPLALIFCFTLAWLADRMGLAALIGAFAAGLILEEVHYEDLARQEEHELEDLLHPLTAFLAPVFFVVMGIRTDVRALGNWHTLGLAVSLVVVSILGKQACALGVLRRGVDRLAVAMGMMPRGEVMLIFAGVGLQLRVGDQPLLAPQTYTALILVLLVTTLLTAPALRWRLGPKQGSRTPSRPG